MLDLREDAITGYRIIKPLGQGGMATVYLALQQNLRREVALKVMAPQLAQGQGFAERFLAEAQLTARLTHPNIMIVHDVGQSGAHYYIATELLPGGTLKERAAQLTTLPDKLRILRGIARGLAYAHQHRVIHRDIKPVNIMFRDDVQPVITDFGIAKALDATHMMTAAGTVIGTPHYMSPEQAQGLPLDGRSDLYSLGIMFYEMLTGQVPFEAPEPLAVLMMHLQQPVPPLPPEWRSVQPVMDQLLAKAPEQRFPNAEALIEALTPLLGKAPTGRISPVAEHLTRLHDQALAAAAAEAAPRPAREAGAITPRTVEQVQPGAGTAPADAGRNKPALGPMHISGYTAGPDSTAHFPRRPSPWWQQTRTWVGSGLTLVLALTVWLWPRDTPVASPDGSAQRPPEVAAATLDAVLAAVRQRMVDGALFEPPGDNAFDRLNLVLDEFPTDGRALAALQALGDAAAVQVRARFDAGERTEALALLRQSREKLRNHPALASLQAELQLRLDQETVAPATGAVAADAQPVSALLERARTLYEASQLVHPPGDNAVEVYRAVLQRDPRNQEASAALERIANHYLDVARTFRDRKRPDQALLQVRNGLKAAADDPRLQRLERELLAAASTTAGN